MRLSRLDCNDVKVVCGGDSGNALGYLVLTKIILYYDLGRFCVLQPDLIEKKEISSFFQMHFKLLRFFCSGQDTKTD